MRVVTVVTACHRIGAGTGGQRGAVWLFVGVGRPAVSGRKVGELLSREDVAPASPSSIPHLLAHDAERVEEARQPPGLFTSPTRAGSQGAQQLGWASVSPSRSRIARRPLRSRAASPASASASRTAARALAAWRMSWPRLPSPNRRRSRGRGAGPEVHCPPIDPFPFERGQDKIEGRGISPRRRLRYARSWGSPLRRSSSASSSGRCGTGSGARHAPSAVRRAFDVVVEVRRGEDDLFVYSLHESPR
jgi:hypothetical protein